jgi:uncharacterized protein (TIGR01777 family)
VRVAVTGSSGLIGSELLVRLRTAGHEVVPLVRRAVRPGETAVRWDPAAGTIDAAGLAGIDAAVHLAGAGIGDERWSPERKRELIESRTLSTSLLASTMASLDPRPGVLVSGSAVGYYGDGDDRVLTEESPPGDDFLANLCQEWEAAADPARDAGIRVSTVRTGLVLARHGGALPKLLPLFKVGLGGRFGSGHQWWSWITLDDEVSALCWLLDHDLTGPFDLTAPEPVTNADFTRELARALHRPALLPVPRFGPRVLMGRELADSLLFTSARVRPAALDAAGFRFAHPTLPEAFASVL